MTKYEDLKGKVVLVTGGASGIGASMVRAFQAQHASVFFCDIDAKAGVQLEAEFESGAAFSKVDLMVESQVTRWIDSVAKRAGPLSVLINNAAADPRIPLGETSVSEWDGLFARNLRAYFLTCRAAAPRMGSGAAIINFSSITVHTGPANMSAYVATKAGIQGLTRSLARELGQRGIRVNTISPGWIMTERQLRQFVTSATKRMIRKAQCVPDLIQPSEIADVALFLASDASRCITGQEILADRGWAHS